MAIWDLFLAPPFHGASMSNVVRCPIPDGFQASHGVDPGFAVVMGVGDGVGDSETAGSGVDVLVGLGVADGCSTGPKFWAALSWTRPGWWLPWSIRASGERLTMEPKAGPVTASRTITTRAAIGRRASWRLGRRALTMSPTATPEAISPGRTAAAIVAPAHAAMTPITTRVRSVRTQPPWSKAPRAPVGTTGFWVSLTKVSVK